MLHAKVRRNNGLTSSNMCMLRELTIRLRCDLKMVDNEGIQVKFLTTLFLSLSLTHSLSFYSIFTAIKNKNENNTDDVDSLFVLDSR